jgi:hypothetical protein
MRKSSSILNFAKDPIFDTSRRPPPAGFAKHKARKRFWKEWTARQQSKKENKNGQV